MASQYDQYATWLHRKTRYRLVSPVLDLLVARPVVSRAALIQFEPVLFDQLLYRVAKIAILRTGIELATVRL